MGDCQLDDLLDMLNDDDEECFAEAEAAAQSSQEDTNTRNSKGGSASSSGSVSEADPEKEALKKQLEAMQKQMMLIKSQLGEGEEEQSVSVKKSVTEVDMFSKTSNVAEGNRQLRSPVKVKPRISPLVSAHLYLTDQSSD